MDEGDAYSREDREEHAKRVSQIKAMHDSRVRAIQETMGITWAPDFIGPPPPDPPPKDAKPAKRYYNKEAPCHQTGKKMWIYFVDSGRWIEGTQQGFDKAIKQGRPVRRSKGKPRFAPEILKEPENDDPDNAGNDR